MDAPEGEFRDPTAFSGKLPHPWPTGNGDGFGPALGVLVETIVREPEEQRVSGDEAKMRERRRMDALGPRPPGENSWKGSGAEPYGDYRLASKTRLKGVSAARRKRVKPPVVTTLLRSASVASVPSTVWPEAMALGVQHRTDAPE